MTIKSFIEKAIEGGWKSEVLWGTAKQYVSDRNLPTMFLDPEAWKAVGRVEGWIDKNYPNGEMRCKNETGRCESRYCEYAGYRDPISFMHRMIDALAEGKTTEQYLETL